MKIVFATNNQHKLSEIRHAVSKNINIVSLKDVNIIEEIPETQDTIEGNAIQKAQFVYDNYGLNCFADDTGLEVTVLNNRPGVYSARYAGPECSSKKNIIKLLGELKNHEDRSAKFRTIIAYVEGSNIFTFEGIAEGQITLEPKGIEGFGYDPVFIPKGYKQTFAEMKLEQKNTISHRAKALRNFIDFLTSRYK